MADPEFTVFSKKQGTRIPACQFPGFLVEAGHDGHIIIEADHTALRTEPEPAADRIVEDAPHQTGLHRQRYMPGRLKLRIVLDQQILTAYQYHLSALVIIDRYVLAFLVEWWEVNGFNPAVAFFESDQSHSFRGYIKFFADPHRIIHGDLTVRQFFR